MGRPARLTLLLVVAAALWIARPAEAQDAPRRLQIGYVELSDDPFYDELRAYARVPLRPLGRPWPGAEPGIVDAAQIGTVIGVEFALQRATGATVDALAQAVEGWAGEGHGFVIADLPAAELLALADRLRDRDVLLLNISAREDSAARIAARTSFTSFRAMRCSPMPSSSTSFRGNGGTSWFFRVRSGGTRGWPRRSRARHSALARESWTRALSH